MLDWTDRHYRHMARQITRHTWLYTEMINAGAVIYGDPDRFLLKNDGENPVALQLGGSEPQDLAKAVAKASAPPTTMENRKRKKNKKTSAIGCRARPKCA